MHTQRRDQLSRYITFKAETQIYLLRLVARLKERGSLADYHRANVLTDYYETWRVLQGGEEGFPRGKVAVCISIISRDTRWKDRLDIFLLRFLFTFTSATSFHGG